MEREDRRENILVVDDSPSVLDVLRDTLEDKGYSVYVATNGEKALARAAQSMPDLILLDVLMPGIDGFETCRRLKADERTRDIPVIFMTGLTDTANKVTGFEAGGVDYVTKPIEVGELVARITMHLSIHDMQEQLKAQNERLQQEIAERKRAEEEIRTLNTELEKRVEERTAELTTRNEQLKEEIEDRRQAEEALRESEERYRVAIEGANDGVAIVKNDVHVYVNKQFLNMFGYDNIDETTGLPPFFTVHPDDRERIPGYVLARQQGEDISGRSDFKGIRKDGTPVYIEISTNMIMYRGEKALLVYFRDITSRKQTEEEHARLATAIEQAAEGIVVTDKNWIVQYVNPAFERMTGYDRDAIISQHARILKSDREDRFFYRKIRNSLTGGDVWSGRLTYRRQDGTYYFAETTASPVRDKMGDIINYVSIHRDITHEVRLERELRQAQKMEAIGTLAGGIAHDFNNILTVIMGATELALRKVAKESPVRHDLDRLLGAALRATDLVRQILTFSRQTEQERKPVQTAPIVKEALKLLRSSLPTTIEIRQNITISPEEDMVFADLTQIHQVLMNLCTNAAHAMHASSGVLDIRLSAMAADAFLVSLHPDLEVGPYVCLEVSDTGHGMDIEIMERIFDPYFTTKAAGEGTGLGLAMVQGIVKSYGGAITVYSEPGHGTTFHVFLPRIEGTITPENEEVDILPTGNERILFVDDEKTLVDLAQEMIEALGYHVIAKSNCLEALEDFRATPNDYDLVITDMTMPGLTGKDLARELMSIRADIPIILCTGFSNLVNEKKAKEAGIREFIMKPYTIADLAKAIRKALEQK